MPTGMSERRARNLAAQIEAEDAHVQAIAQPCASQNPWYRNKTWQVVAILKHWNLKQQCYQPKQWQNIQGVWAELRREEG